MLTKETFDRATIKINYTVKPILMQDGTRQWWKTDAGASASISVSLFHAKLHVSIAYSTKLQYHILIDLRFPFFGFKIILQWLTAPILI